MYTKQEASQLRQQFWTAFGQYMQPVPSADGDRVNWINYKTCIRDIYFRMDADERQATVSIEMTGSFQDLYFEQFEQLRGLLQNALNESWDWQARVTDEHGHVKSRIFTTIQHVNILKPESWPGLISFFKPRIVALDSFWSNARYTFEGL